MINEQWIGHPCFDERARHKFSRVHLPVAPKCNIQCNFCDRKYDCVNESRPGVTSVILSPGQAMVYLERILSRLSAVSVVGIAGPGDPLANPVETLETLSLVRARYPKMLLCLATNGLALPKYVDRIAELLVSHVTVTVNAIDPDIGSRIYSWVRDGKRILRGREAAELLLERQMEGIRLLKQRGVTVKINFILTPGVNDGHAGDVAKVVSHLGADIFNCMALIPSKGSEFGSLIAPTHSEHEEARSEAAKYIPQMRHCARCRADAVGIIGREMDESIIKDLKDCSLIPLRPSDNRPYVAVSTIEGIFVNQHLGMSEEFQIFERKDDSFQLKEVRNSPKESAGDERWQAVAKVLNDCRAVLVSAAGSRPVEFLKGAGIDVIEMEGLIEQGLDSVYNGVPLPGRRMNKGCSGGHGTEAMPLASSQACGGGNQSCGGNGMGCL